MGHTAASVGTFTFLQAGPWWRPQGLPWPRSPATGHADLQGPQGQRGATLEPGVLLEFQAHRHYPTQPERRQGQSKEGESDSGSAAGSANGRPGIPDGTRPLSLTLFQMLTWNQLVILYSKWVKALWPLTRNRKGRGCRQLRAQPPRRACECRGATGRPQFSLPRATPDWSQTPPDKTDRGSHSSRHPLHPARAVLHMRLCKAPGCQG